ncbi:MAG: ribbon-helix-helix protein, CopG family [Elusimicrobia bacterium]|nr:ribbon-helix-helix protein, CopG family [Elusimicrobiota bacterium]
MANSVKRAISLPRKQDERLQNLAKRRGAPYSRLVQDAIQNYLKIEEESRLDQAYRRYYRKSGR